MVSESIGGIAGFYHLKNDFVHEDNRGFFMRALLESDLQCYEPREINTSVSRKSTIRGMHLQLHKPQGKLVRVTHGAIYDVCLDLRPASSTFKKWASYTLQAHDGWLWLPPGVAHGFQALAEHTSILYLCNKPYIPEYSVTINPLDEELGIDWPIAPPNPILISQKDVEAPSLIDYLKRV